MSVRFCVLGSGSSGNAAAPPPIPPLFSTTIFTGILKRQTVSISSPENPIARAYSRHLVSNLPEDQQRWILRENGFSLVQG